MSRTPPPRAPAYEGGIVERLGLDDLPTVAEKYPYSQFTGTPDLNDLISHRRSWREALVKCAERAAVTGDDDNREYWNHELNAFDRTFSVFK